MLIATPRSTVAAEASCQPPIWQAHAVMNTKELGTTVDIAAASNSVAGFAKKLRLDLRSVIEKDVQAEVNKAKPSPDQLERHIRSAFMNGMVLGARLQTKSPDATTNDNGWCGLVEEAWLQAACQS
jgi:hypothetical protein